MLSRQALIALAIGSFVGLLLLSFSRFDASFGAACAAGGAGCMKYGNSWTYGKGWGRLVSTDKRRPLFMGQSDEEACRNFPDTSNILLVMKTSASETYAKIPTHAITMLRCLPDYLIYSDMDQEVAGQYVMDALSSTHTKTKQENPDFASYLRQRACPVDQETCNTIEESGEPGRALDKYKPIHIAEKAFHERPGYDWYLFIDTEGYVFWPTVVEWLKKMDPLEQHYLGSIAMLSGVPYAQGRSGYVMSQELMRQMFSWSQSLANSLDSNTAKVCCGDYILGKAVINNSDTEVQDMWPTLNNDKPYTVKFSTDQWCQPLATMRGLTPEEISSVWNFEQRRGFGTGPLRVRDLFNTFLLERLQKRRADWNNLAGDFYYINATEALDADSDKLFEDWEVRKSRGKQWELTPEENVAHQSEDTCERACEAMKDCMQWMYRPGLCILDRKASLGRPSKRQDGQRVTSGWMVEKIRRWADETRCDGEMVFPLPGGDEEELKE